MLVTRQECRDVPQQQCTSVPQEQCTTVEDQVCTEVQETQCDAGQQSIITTCEVRVFLVTIRIIMKLFMFRLSTRPCSRL